MQLEAVILKIAPGKPYWQWCQMQGLPEFVIRVPYPHRYLILWLECEHRRNPNTGIRPYPRSGEYEDQDAETTLAFEVLDEYREQQRKEQEVMRKVQEAAHQNAYSL